MKNGCKSCDENLERERERDYDQNCFSPDSDESIVSTPKLPVISQIADMEIETDSSFPK